ncbi:pectate lyase-like adhesive domain-containing protein [Enterococcus sp. LJL51]|uniref:pectate lyase-like adhesive domain-containing protein n=1 Tax=Enterococcus sp. LJL51 TaxID=3416656 RepID=UPI003CF1B899
MKIGKKSYFWLVLLSAILIVGSVFRASYIKASEEEYGFEVSDVSETTKSVTLKVQNPVDEELVLNYSGLKDVSEEVIQEGLSKSFDGELIVSTINEGSKKLEIKKGTEAFETTFLVEKSEEAASADLKLVSSKQTTLAEAKLAFADSSVDLTENLMTPPTQEDFERQEYSKSLEVAPMAYVPSTDSELDLADAAYYAAKGNFNPDANIAYVSNWTEFVRAYKNNAVTKIKLTASIASENISVDGVSTTIFGDNADEYRKASVVIDGGYVDGTGAKKEYGLTLSGSKMLRTSDAPTGFTETAADGSQQTRSMIHLKDLSIAQPGAENGYSYGFVGAPGVDTTVAGENANAPYSRNWYFRFTNVNTDIDDNNATYTGVARAVVGYQAEVTLAGKVTLSVTGEPFYLGSLIVEPGTSFRGITEYSNYSVVWFVDRIDKKTTGATGELTIGKDSFVYLKNVTTGASYPGFYGDYGDAVIDEGATLNIDMQGNAWRFDTYDSTVRVKKDATLNLISRGTGAVLTYGGGPGPFADGYNAITHRNTFIVEPEASFFAYGKTGTNTGTIETQASSTNNSFVLDSPKSFDIRNSTNNTASNNGSYRAVNMYNGLSVANGRNSNSFEIINSDISLWRNGAAGGSSNVDIDGLASEEYVKVGGFKMNSQNSDTYAAANTNPYPVATDANFATTLGKFNPPVVKRIAGRNTPPEVIWNPTTDADKTLKVRVYLGERPTGYDQDGNTILVPVYAGQGEASVYFTDTYGNNYGPILTDANGYASVPVDFQKAGQQVTAHAERGPAEPNKWTGDDKSTTVIDVTPPEPAKVVDDKITNATKQLIAENLEAGAKVFLTITGTTANAGTMIPAGTVGADGKWTHNLSAYLNTGDTVTIYLQDNAGVAAGQAGELPFDPAAPSTNSANGNINPSPNDLSYRDATFTKATVYTVSDSIPESSLTKEQKFYRKGTEITSGIQVNDVVRYTLTVRNTKAATLDTTWKDVAITDVLPTGINFELATANLKINNTDPAAGAVTYDEGTRTLTVNAGSLASSTEAVITFDAVINRNAVGFKLKNEATALGYSPRESNNPFVPGVNPTPTYEEITATAQVETPGTIAGVLEITSGPSVLNFGVRSNNTDTRVNKAEYTEPLVVTDTRAQRDSWKLMVEVTQDLTHQTDTSKTLPGALRYKYGSRPELTLNGSPQEIYRDSSGTAGDFVISDNWSEAGDGFKLQIPAGRVQAMGEYQAEILWTLQDAN